MWIWYGQIFVLPDFSFSPYFGNVLLASLRCVARCVARRAFYSGSVVVNISRNTLPGVNGGTPQISMENVANRRRFEVPGEY